MTQELDRADGLRLLEALDAARNHAETVPSRTASWNAEKALTALSNFLLTHARALLDDGWRGIESLPLMDDGGIHPRSAVTGSICVQDALSGALHSTVIFEGERVWPSAKLWQPLPPPPQTEQT